MKIHFPFKKKKWNYYCSPNGATSPAHTHAHAWPASTRLMKEPKQRRAKIQITATVAPSTTTTTRTPTPAPAPLQPHSSPTSAPLTHVDYHIAMKYATNASNCMCYANNSHWDAKRCFIAADFCLAHRWSRVVPSILAVSLSLCIKTCNKQQQKKKQFATD